VRAGNAALANTVSFICCCCIPSLAKHTYCYVDDSECGLCMRERERESEGGGERGRGGKEGGVRERARESETILNLAVRRAIAVISVLVWDAVR